jgi:hypothetical protein
MPLLVVHQILIGAAIALSGIFGVRALVGFVRRGASLDLGLALASLVVGVGLTLYFRTVRARWAEIRTARRDPPR